jgi:hypothetical protein
MLLLGSSDTASNILLLYFIYSKNTPDYKKQLARFAAEAKVYD